MREIRKETRRGLPLAVALVVAGLVLLVAGELPAVEPADPRLVVDVPAHIRRYAANPDGSCVQCSLVLIGFDQNVPAASTLLWDTPYGPAERGGSSPERVARYAKSRGIKCYNVTGKEAFAYMKWAASTGRGAAIGCGSIHMQSLFGYDPKTSTWYVCNNNSTQKIDAYTNQQFEQLCYASGLWVVVLMDPPHPARPDYKKWWGEQDAAEKLELVSYKRASVADRNGDGVVWFAGSTAASSPEVNTREVLRRGDCVQVIGDGVAASPLIDQFGEVLAMPSNDADKWYIYVIADMNGARSKRCIAAFSQNNELRSFALPDDPKRSWSHYTVYEQGDSTQQWRWEKIQLTGTPTVIVQPPRSGRYGDPTTVVYQAVYGDNPAETADGIRHAILRYLQRLPNPPLLDAAVNRPDCGPDCKPPFNPPPKPEPFPAPDADRRPFAPLIPPVDAVVHFPYGSAIMSFVWWIIGLVVVSGLVVVLLVSFVVVFLAARWAWRRALSPSPRRNLRQHQRPRRTPPPRR